MRETSTHKVESITKLVSDQQKVAAVKAKEKPEYPPGYVFAPGFLLADRRGLVPYPGVHLSPSMMDRLGVRTPEWLANSRAQTSTATASEAKHS